MRGGSECTRLWGTAQQEDFQDGSQSAHFIGEGSNLASEATPEAVK
jgi:hypothetical protein